jgi:hypothetical protein
MAVFVWKEDYKLMKSRMDKCKGNESNAWVLIYNQCLEELKNKLRGMQDYDTAKSGNNVAKLLTMIRGYCCQFNLLSDEYMAIVAAIKNLFYFFQKAEQSFTKSSRCTSQKCLCIIQPSHKCPLHPGYGQDRAPG